MDCGVRVTVSGSIGLGSVLVLFFCIVLVSGVRKLKRAKISTRLSTIVAQR